MFRTVCTNPKCKNLQAPYIDPKTEKIYCSDCDQEIKLQVTNIIKNQMKANKQYREKKKLSFMVVCETCDREDRPIIYEGDLYCKICKHEVTSVSSFYKNLILQKLPEADKDA